MNLEINNIAHFCGNVDSELKYSHEVFGEKFYTFMLKVERLSGQTDCLPFIVSERLLGNMNISCGDRLCLDGQIRSYNVIKDGKSRLVLQVFVKEITPAEEGIPDENSIYLQGYICKPPVYRITPFSREIADVLLAVNRAYNKSDYIPCICWGRNARYCEHLETGQYMSVTGRLQSREYQKKSADGEVETRVAYEVSVGKMCLSKEDNDLSI